MEANTQTILIVFVALTGLAVLMQACVLFGIFLSLRKTSKLVLDVTDDLKVTVVPLVHSTRELMERVAPQMTTIATGLAELTELVHKESKGISVSASEIMERVSRQTARLDAMVSAGLDSVERSASALETIVAKPVRQANGIFAAVKAMVETYSGYPSRSTHLSRRHTPHGDEGVEPRL